MHNNNHKSNNQVKLNIHSNKICIFNNLRDALELRCQTYVWYKNDNIIYYRCCLKNNYTYSGYIDGDYKYTEISKKQSGALYRYYPKILTYSNEYTHEPIIYTQEYDHPSCIELWVPL